MAQVVLVADPSEQLVYGDHVTRIEISVSFGNCILWSIAFVFASGERFCLFQCRSSYGTDHRLVALQLRLSLYETVERLEESHVVGMVEPNTVSMASTNFVAGGFAACDNGWSSMIRIRRPK